MATKLGVHNNDDGDPVLTIACRTDGYDVHELTIGSNPWNTVTTYIDTDVNAIRSGGRPASWSTKPLCEATSHFSYGIGYELAIDKINSVTSADNITLQIISKNLRRANAYNADLRDVSGSIASVYNTSGTSVN
jgi:hypothetical protein